MLSLSLQGVDVDIVFGIKQILKTSSTLTSLVNKSPLQWPTVKLVLDRLKDEGAEKTYQGVVLKSYNQQTLDYCAKEAIAGLNKLNDKMKERLEWSNVEVL